MDRLICLEKKNLHPVLSQHFMIFRLHNCGHTNPGSQGTFSRVFDLETLEIDLENGKGNDDFSTRDGRFPVNAGITGFVAATKQTVNIPDAYSDKK